MTVTTRFAPSPTGRLHFGNLRTALICWLWARRCDGRFVLRLDDTDQERSTDAFAQSILDDLHWLGLDWDRLERQSGRRARYTAAIEALKGAGRLYPCYETPEELALQRKAQLGAGKPPRYNRAALDLSATATRELEAAGRRPHYRFKLNAGPIAWDDRVRGPVHFEGAELSDPVVIRENGTPLYHLCSVIDDIDYAVTDVVRGEDHVANTATHIQMFEALGATPPFFAHLSLIVDADGKALSKRLGSLTIAHFRDVEGLEPAALLDLMGRIGTSDPIEPFTDLAPLIAGFDFARFSRAAPRFDEAELHRLNARILHALPFEAVEPKLKALDLAGVDAEFWNTVSPNIAKLREVGDWWHIAHDKLPAPDREHAFLAQAATLLPPEPWGADVWATWTAAIKQTTGRKGKALFLPLRRALTGLDHGPELRLLLPLIGYARTLARLVPPTD